MVDGGFISDVLFVPRRHVHPRLVDFPQLLSGGYSEQDENLIARWNYELSRRRTREQYERRQRRRRLMTDNYDYSATDRGKIARLRWRLERANELEESHKLSLKDERSQAWKRRRYRHAHGGLPAPLSPFGSTATTGATGMLPSDSQRAASSRRELDKLVTESESALNGATQLGLVNASLTDGHEFFKTLLCGNFAILSILISSTETVEYTTYYHIRVSAGADYEWSVRKTYEDFAELHETLIGEFAQLQWVYFPPQYSFGETWSSVIEERSTAFEQYLRQLLALPHSEHLDAFLAFSMNLLPLVCAKYFRLERNLAQAVTEAVSHASSSSNSKLRQRSGGPRDNSGSEQKRDKRNPRGGRPRVRDGDSTAVQGDGVGSCCGGGGGGGQGTRVAHARNGGASGNAPENSGHLGERLGSGDESSGNGGSGDSGSDGESYGDGDDGSVRREGVGGATLRRQGSSRIMRVDVASLGLVKSGQSSSGSASSSASSSSSSSYS